MRIAFVIGLLALAAGVWGQLPDDPSNDAFSSTEMQSKTSDTPSLPTKPDEIESVKNMDNPSLPSATEEIDLLAVPEMPKSSEKLSEETSTTSSPSADSSNIEDKLTTTATVIESVTTLEPASAEAKPEENNPLMSAPQTPEEATIEPKLEATATSMVNEKSMEDDAFASKSTETTNMADKIESTTEQPKSAETTKEKEKSMEATTSTPELPETKSTELKMSSEVMNTDPFQQGTQAIASLPTATEKSKEIEEEKPTEEPIGSKTEDQDLKVSTEALPVPVVKSSSEEKTENVEVQKPTTNEHSTDSDLDLKERPLVPIVREDENFTTQSIEPVEETTPEAKMTEETKMDEKSTKEIKTTIAMPIEESTQEINKQESKEVSETPLPAGVPIPVEPTHQPMSHMISSGSSESATTNLIPAHMPNESAGDEETEQTFLVTSVPMQSETSEKMEDGESMMEKITKSPAERPQFEEPKQETTEKTSLGMDANEKQSAGEEMKEPEEFGHGTESPSLVPTAETHLMTTESGESGLRLLPTVESPVPQLPNKTEEPKLDTQTTPLAPIMPEQTATESTIGHVTDEEGLFAGDMRNLFANHHHETTAEPKFAEEITEQEGNGNRPEPTAHPEPEPTAEPTSAPEPTAEPKAVPEPTAEPTSAPEPSAEPEPTAEPEPSPNDHVHHSHTAHVPETAITDTIKTPFSLRFTNIDFTSDFNNLNSGAARKLHDQIYDDLSRVFESTLGDNYVGFELVGFRKGSLIVDGRLLSRDELGNPSMVAAKLEDSLQKEGGRLGGNVLDLKSVYVDGIVSTGSAQQDSASAAANTGYIVGGSIAIGVLIMAFIVFAVIVFGVNARRNKSRTLKLKEELSMAEHGRSPFGGNGNGRQNGGGNGPVNLMSYGNTTPSSANGHSTTTTAAANNSPMLLNSSQFASPQAFQSSN